MKLRPSILVYRKMRFIRLHICTNPIETVGARRERLLAVSEAAFPITIRKSEQEQNELFKDGT